MKNLLSIRSYSTKPTRHSHHFNQLVLPLRGVINICVGNFNVEQAMFEMFSLLLAEQPLLPKVDNRIGTAISFIEQNIASQLQIKRLAESAFLSDTQFKKLFKQQTGMTVMKYVTKLRMEKAQALLTHTDYPLPIIGEKVGYKEPSAFSRKFSQYFGLSPTKFKK